MALGIIFAGVFSFGIYVFAAPPDSPYAPGETLNPACAAGSSNCTVTSPVPYTGATAAVNLGSQNLTTSGTVTFSGFTTNGGFLYTNGSGVLAQGGVGTAGQVLTSNGAGAVPTFQAVSAGVTRWDQLTSPTSALSLTMPATNETTFTVQSTTQAGFAMASSTLTSGRLLALTSTSTALATNTGLLKVSSSGANASTAVTAYGVYSTVTNTNATSGTNVAGYFSASGATTANYGLIVDAGNVGIGDTSPAALFTVGSGDLFQVNSSGAIAAVVGITSSSNYSQSAGTFSLTSANTTQVTTASALALNVNSLTTGTGLYAASSALTTGKLVDLQVSGTAAAASQTALNILTTGANATNAITTYGAQISNTHTNATSGTNVALYLNASGATTANYGLIVNAGNVGVGDTSPASLFTVGSGDLFQVNSSGVVVAGTWNGDVIGPAYGGTGVANNAASTLAISGNFATTLTVSGTTGVTLPTTGTLATLAGSEAFTNKDLSSSNTFPTFNQNTTGSAATLTTARTIGGVSFNGSANITVASATGGFTVSGGNLDVSAVNLVTDTTTGTKIGTATNQKIGFFNSTPIVQPTGNVLTALSNLGLVGTPTLTSTNVGLGNVENTALSTWAGTTNITTLGTIASGTWNGTAIAVANGGTGNTSLTAYAVLAGGTTSTGALQQVSGVGTSGYVLTSTGAGALPTWQAVSAGATRWDQLTSPTSALSLTMPATNETDFTVQSTTQAGFTWNSSTLTSGQLLALTSTSTALATNTGLLKVSSSGANASTAVTAYGVYSTVTNTNATSGTNVAGYFSASGATTANYGLIVDAGNVGIGDTSPASALTVGDGDLFQVNSSGVVVAGTWNGTAIAIANGGTGNTSASAAFDALSPMTTGGDIIYGGASGAGTRLANGSAGQVLTSAGTTIAPTWETPTTGTVTSVSGTTDRITVATGTTTPAIDISSSYVGQASITTLGTITTGAWNGTTIAIANGGTGQVTATAALNELDPLVSRGDLISHDATDSVRLPVGDNNQVLTADSTQVSGLKWADPNVETNHNFLSATHPDTVSGSPVRGDLVVGNITSAWTKLAVGPNNRFLRSDGIDPLWAQVGLTSDVSGTLPVESGGTGQTAWTQYLMLYADTANSLSQVPIGTSGQVLTSNGGGSVASFQEVNAANKALSNLAFVAINTALLPDTAGVLDFGSSIKPWADIHFSGTSASPETNNFRLTGASTSGVRVITFPDASGTLPLTSNNLSVFADTTSAQMAGVISNETGSGLLVFATNPTLTTPILGDASLTKITNLINNGFVKTSGGDGTLSVDTTIYEDVANKSTDVSLGTSDVLYPTQNATKSYVDSVASGLSLKASVQTATTATLPANTYDNGASGVGATLTADAVGVLTVDGFAVLLNDRILIKDEASALKNGIYKCTTEGTAGVAYVLTRSTDNDTSAEILKSFTFVAVGTVNNSTGWVNTNTGAITIGTTEITWTQFSSAGVYTGGTGITVAGTVVSIDTAWPGQTALTILGTVGTGTWNATNIGLNRGGTNASLTASSGGILYSTASAGAILAGTATANRMLLSGSSAAPSWSTSTIPSSAGATANRVLLSDGTNYVLSALTFPNAAATTGKFIRSDGTNWIASTPTLPISAGTAGKLLRSDGTNYVESTATFPGTAGASGQFIISDGTNWITSTPTLPTGALSNQRVMTSVGGAIVESGVVNDGESIQRNNTTFISAPLPLSTIEGRLTLTSGIPITTADVTGATTIYFAPYKGNRVYLYDGTRWRIYSFTQLSLSLGTLTNARPYDVFLYDNAGTLTLELLAWTNGTTRATALVAQDGVLLLTGATTRRYLGTFYTSSTTTTEDSAAKRFVWNNYNRVQRKLSKLEATASWTYGTATFRSLNNSTANRVEVVVGQAEVIVDLHASVIAQHSVAGGYVNIGIAVDATNTSDADLNQAGFSGAAGHNSLPFAIINHSPTVGYHFYQATEYAGSATATFFGGNSGGRRTGLLGNIEG